MFSHVTIGANDMARAARFYDAFLAPLGIARFWTSDDGRVIGWKREGEAAKLFVGSAFDGRPASAGNGTMVALTAPSPDAVRRAHAAALQAGGMDEGAPGPRPQYTPDYYGAYVRDPEGNKLHAVYRGPPETALA